MQSWQRPNSLGAFLASSSTASEPVFFRDQSQIYNKVTEHQSLSRVDDHQVRQFVEKCLLPASSRPNSLELSVDSAFLAFNKASQDKKRLDVGANLFIGNLDPDVDEKLLYDTFSAFGVIASNPKIMHDPETGNSRGFGFISYDSFEASDAAIEAMTGQYLCNRQITVSYAYKKDTKGARHGTPAERLLAATNPSSQKSRPHTLFASGPPSHPNAPQANGIPRPFANGGMQPVPMLAPRPTPPPPPPQAYQTQPPSWPPQQQQQHGLAIPPPQFRPTQGLPPPPPPQFLHHQ